MTLNTRCVIVSAFFLMIVVLPVVAQDCSIQTVTGTYVFRGVGQSFVGGAPFPATVPPNPAAGVLPFHAPGAYLGGTHVGVLTVHPDYSVDTISWLAMGPYRLEPAGLRSPAAITSLEAEKTPDGAVLGCAATIQYPSTLGADVVDKFVIFENGKEMRGVHFSNGNPSTTSLFVAKRLTRSADPAPRCGAQTIKGSYVATCSAAPLYLGSQTLSTAAMFLLKIGMDGNVSGKLFNRIESQAAVVPVSGLLTMNDDCTGDGYLQMPGFLPSPEAKMLYKLLAYDEGKAGFLMPLQIEMPNGTRSDYFSSMSCQVERTDP